MAEHFLEEVSSENSWIDGDGSGRVDLGDVFAIADNFLCNVAGYSVQASDTDYGTFVDFAIVEIGQAPPNAPIFLSATIPDTPLSFFRVVPFDSAGTKGVPSLPVKKNYAPIVSFTATPEMGRIPLTVSFDASGSYDKDGEITLYEWDFDCDSLFDYSSQAEKTAQFTYEAEGNYSCTLRLTDDRGAVSSAGADITAYYENLPPIAVLVAEPLVGSAPLSVTFDAHDSYDPDGTIVRYQWDMTGDGYFEMARRIILRRNLPMR